MGGERRDGGGTETETDNGENNEVKNIYHTCTLYHDQIWFL